MPHHTEPPPPPPPAVRPPRQERGQRRYDEILDAAARLVEEVGPDAVTVQAISVRARASKGSMYHFFPDRESVLAALVERHIDTLRASLEAEREALAGAAAASADGAVRAFLEPVDAYVRRHPDLPRIMREPGSQKRLADQGRRLAAVVEAHAAWMLARRYPALAGDALAASAAIVVAIVSGLRTERVLAALGSAEAVAQEMRRVLQGYVEALGD
ncbi:MAG TPA: helix-turn-helix domain-containing protein [Longimicrobiaceae bacterium]|nr:helix-turn-helix domain-containing protein [Longimicrobiaceae bacterium]